VRDVSLTLAPGEILGLVGESGAGKSTVGRLILRLERPDGGRLVFEGTDLAGLAERELRRVRARMHLIFQDPYQSLHPGMRVGEAVAEPLAIAGTDRRTRRERAAQALDEVDLTPPDRFLDRYPHELSGGQRQRVAVARAIVNLPCLVVADEPTSMLDVSLRAGILELLEGMRARHGISFVFITHDLAVARHICDRIGVMYQGELVELGSSDQVVNETLHPYTRTLLDAVDELTPPPPASAAWPAGDHGCPYYGRCDRSIEVCATEDPELAELRPGHQAACHVARAAVDRGRHQEQ
jgi:peptide/nickel transport system ATP-binding protein